MPAVGQLSEGIYEKVRTVGLEAELDRLGPAVKPEFDVVHKADAPDVVARHVANAVRRLLADVDDEQRRVSLTNDLLTLLRVPDEQLPGAIEHLIALTSQLAPESPDIIRPVTPLSQSQGSAPTRSRWHSQSDSGPSRGCLEW